jgi:phosphoacetylglucosamine mutase
VFVDGANGVGASKMRAMLPLLGDSLKVNIFNDGTKAEDVLNSGCGADFVKVSDGRWRTKRTLRAALYSYIRVVVDG